MERTRYPYQWRWTTTLLLTLAVCIVTLCSLNCLYVEKIQPLNKKPSAIIELVIAQDLIYVGERVILSAENSRDPENNKLTYEWSIEYEMGLENPFEECGPQAGSGSCDGGGQPTCCFLPMAKTNYTVSLRVFDPEGLRSEIVEKEIFVNNQEPEAEITAETLPNERYHYIVGQDIWLHAFHSKDPDTEDVLSYGWEVERPSASQTNIFVFEPSDEAYQPTEEPLEMVRCLMVPDVSGSYFVSLTVNDGELENTTDHPLEVDPDAPPCILETSPADATKNNFLVFDLLQPHRLEVLRVEDDLDSYPPEGGIHFDWQISNDEGTSFHPVGGHHDPYLDLFPDDFSPGQVLWVRAIVSDREERELSCGSQELRCSPNCPQWVTWIIEFR